MLEFIGQLIRKKSTHLLVTLFKTLQRDWSAFNHGFNNEVISPPIIALLDLPILAFLVRLFIFLILLFPSAPPILEFFYPPQLRILAFFLTLSA